MRSSVRIPTSRSERKRLPPLGVLFEPLAGHQIVNRPGHVARLRLRGRASFYRFFRLRRDLPGQVHPRPAVEVIPCPAGGKRLANGAIGILPRLEGGHLSASFVNLKSSRSIVHDLVTGKPFISVKASHLT